MATSLSNEEVNDNFLKWCDNKGIDFNGNELIIKETESKNRHIVTNKFIPEGTILFKIPYKALINPLNSPIAKKNDTPTEPVENTKSKVTETSENNEESSDEEEEEQENNSTDEWKNLVVVIFQELAKGEKSNWYPYLQILPHSENHKFDNLYYWTEEELEMLSPSKCVNRLGLDKIKQMYNEIQEDFEIKEMTFERFLQISSIIMSYSFDVNVKSMVPVADLLNASVNNNAILQVDDENEEFISMVATKDIQKDEEIYNIYGDHPNGELLRMYGYVEEGNFNEFAELELKKLANIDSKYQDIIDMIDDVYDLEDPLIMESYDVYLQGGIMSELLVLCEILTTYRSENTEDELKSLIRTAFKRVIKKNQISTETKKIIDTLVNDRINEYKANKNNNHKCSETGYSKKYMASVVVKSELECLEKCIDLLEKEYEIIDDKEEELKMKEKERLDKKRKRLEKRQERKNNKKSKH